VNKCYAYGRHSTAKQGLTEDAQYERCLAYWDHNLAHLGVEWGGFFYDEAVSGKRPLSERPHGRIVYFLAQDTDHIVTARYDRCFRNALDGMLHLKAFEDRGVTFHSDKEKIDTSTAMGRAFRTMLLAMAEVERDLASERTLEIQASLRAAGKPHCKGCPIGWRIVRTTFGREYRVDEDERRLAKAMVKMHNDGMSYDRIASWATRQTQYPAKRGYSFANKVKWAVLACEFGFPKGITNYREFFRAVKDGTVTSGQVILSEA
jgi:DNA invertase Pin-like site-specific DNA recombinase